MRQQIREWLDEPKDYIKGVNLYYDITGKIATRDSLLRLKSVNKLKNYLQGILDDMDTKQDVAIEKAVETPIYVVAENTEDATLVAMNNTMILLYKELGVTHSKLLECDTDAERFEIAKQCLVIDAKQSKLLEEMAYYKNYGRMPTRAPLPKDSKCDESMAEKKLQLSRMPALLWVDRRKLNTLKEKLSNCHDIDQMRKIKSEIEKTEARYQEKEARKVLLENELKNM